MKAVIIGVFAAAWVAAHDMPMPQQSKDFQNLKKIEGTWEGSKHGQADGNGMPGKLTAEYHVTSGGSAIEERLFPGSPHEMVSVYYDANGKPMMTHYCAMGNRPMMSLKSADGKSFEFDFVKSPGIDEKTDDHMHSLNIAFTDDDHMTQTWTSFKGGKESEKSVFKFTRVKK